MPNGHFIHPVIHPSQWTDGVSEIVFLFQQLNQGSGLSVLIWVGLAIVIAIALFAMLRRHT
jgi:hypothetical protein